MRKEFLVERQGRQFVLYAGLLALGHEQGLKSIRTHLLQIPNETNNRVAICSATVVLEKEGVEREFHGIGDAAPNNVAAAMANCTIRLAETRAKARALRDAVNVGMAALEELGDEDAYEGAPERGYALGNARATRSVPARAATSGQSTDTRPKPAALKPGIIRPSDPTPIPAALRNPLANPITESQMEAIRSLCRRRNIDVEAAAKERFDGEGLSGLTQAQASDLIKTLQAEASNGRSASAVA